MGAQPKKQLAKSKQRSRAAHYRAATHGLSYCPHCHSAKLPHRVCATCGRYRDREIIEIPLGQERG